MSPSGPATAPIAPQRPLLLGSASPRRRQLLEQMAIPLIVRGPVVDERERSGETPEAYLQRIVDAKAAAVGNFEQVRSVAAWLCADTCVVVGGKILGKPRDDAEAFGMLSALAGCAHEVLTRYAIHSADLERARAERTVRTSVTMRAASADELERYVATGEGRDKAGSYAVQGIGAFLVTRVDGSYSNVVGLPVCEVVGDLLSLGLLREFP